MPKIIVNLKSKGGVVKSTTAVNLAAKFGQKNQFILIYADIQASAILSAVSLLLNGEETMHSRRI